MESYTDSFVRNRFEEGMLLSAADLTNLQSYLDDKRRLGYRNLIGYGIVCGLTVKNASDRVTIEPGLAVDHKGREIYLPAEVAVRLDSLFPGGSESGECFLCAEYAEEPCGEAFIISDKKLREPAHNRIRETFAFTAKHSRDKEDICIARLTAERQNSVLRISSVQPSVDSFYFAPIFRNFLPGYKSGLIYIDDKDIPNEDGIFMTEERYHGLGPGKDVVMELSVKTYDQWRACEVFGDPQLFELPVRTAAKLYPESGTFIAAVKPSAPLTAPICVRWRARALREDHGHA